MGYINLFEFASAAGISPEQYAKLVFPGDIEIDGKLLLSVFDGGTGDGSHSIQEIARAQGLARSLQARLLSASTLVNSYVEQRYLLPPLPDVDTGGGTDIDTTRPTCNLIGPDLLIYSNNDPFFIAAKFSERVSSFTPSDVTLNNATVTILGSGADYSLRIVPDGSNEDIGISVHAGVVADSSGNLNILSNRLIMLYVDVAAPTVALTGPATFGATGPFNVTASFSEPVAGLSSSDVDVTGGFVTVSGFGANYNLIVRPYNTDNNVEIVIPPAATRDEAGIGNIESNRLVVRFVDTTAPSVSLSGTAVFSTRNTFNLSARFSTAVIGFNDTDVVVTGGTASVSGGGDRYVLAITPDNTSGDISVTIPANAAVDRFDNPSTASNTFTVVYTNAAPSVILTGPDSGTFTARDRFPVEARFSQVVTGFTGPDVNISGGSVRVTSTHLGLIYTLEVTPDRSTGAISIFIPEDSATNQSGNANLPSNRLTLRYDPPISVEIKAPETFMPDTPILATEEYSGTGSDGYSPHLDITGGSFESLDDGGSGNCHSSIITPDGSGENIVITIPAGTNGNVEAKTVTIMPDDGTAPPIPKVRTLLGSFVGDGDMVKGGTYDYPFPITDKRRIEVIEGTGSVTTRFIDISGPTPSVDLNGQDDDISSLSFSRVIDVSGFDISGGTSANSLSLTVAFQNNGYNRFVEGERVVTAAQAAVFSNISIIVGVLGATFELGGTYSSALENAVILTSPVSFPDELDTTAVSITISANVKVTEAGRNIPQTVGISVSTLSFTHDPFTPLRRLVDYDVDLVANCDPTTGGIFALPLESAIPEGETWSVYYDPPGDG